VRVGLDLTPVISGDTGVSLYGRMLYEEAGTHADVALFPFAIGRGADAPFELHRVRTPLRILHRTWQWFGWPRAEQFTGRVDVVHSVDMIPPPSRAPLVMSVQDVLPLTIPEYYGERFIRISRAHANATKRAALLLSLCASTADHIAEVTGFPRERIVIARPGRRAPSVECPPSPVAPPFILAVGSVTPRKGFEVLAEALARLGPSAPPVVVAGPDGWRSDEVRARVVELGVADRMTFVGRVDDAALEGLYRHATILCHPSVAEGFGIPCLEAMGYGLPVVAADIPSVREMGDRCMLLAPPGDAEALAEALSATLTDDEERARRVAEGVRLAAAYTWTSMADAAVGAWRTAAA
jgi:glycosyltransferase involved in cell wall biosynthesis